MAAQLLAKRAMRLKPSPTFSISAKANAMKKEGVDVLNLSLGEPDFGTANEACDAAINAIKAGKTKYTNVDGIPELKRAVQAKFASENSLDFELNEIAVTVGAKQGIFNAMMVSLDEGDEVIIPAPCWVSYVDIVEFAGGKPVVVRTRPEDGFKLKARDLKNAITPHTKWLFLNSPSNPTGEVYEAQELREIADILLENPHVYVLSDDIYEHLVFDGRKFLNLLNVCPDLASRVLIINGVSKAYSMTGWRIGYACMKDSRFIKAMVDVQGQSTSNASSVSQEAALGALRGGVKFPHFERDVMQKRRDLVFEGIKKIAGIGVSKPSGAFYIFFSVEKLLGKKTRDGKILNSSLDFVEWMLAEGRVALVHGEAFEYPGFVRISYATSEQILLEAIERIKKTIDTLL